MSLNASTVNQANFAVLNSKFGEVELYKSHIIDKAIIRKWIENKLQKATIFI